MLQSSAFGILIKEDEWDQGLVSKSEDSNLESLMKDQFYRRNFCALYSVLPFRTFLRRMTGVFNSADAVSLPADEVEGGLTFPLSSLGDYMKSELPWL